ncbi:MAG: hypothetical protein ACI8ZM_002515 [Crocinitomix sp.]|jgi:hypothetical protein
MKLKDITTSKIVAFFKKIPEAWQELSEFEAINTESVFYTKTMQAKFSEPWDIRGFEQPLKNVFIFVDFPEDSKIQNSIRLKGTMKVGNENIIFIGQLYEDEFIRFIAEKNSSELSEMFVPSKKLPADFIQWMDLLPLELNNRLRFDIVAVDSGIQINNNLRIEIENEICITGTSICVKDPYLSLTHFYNQDAKKTANSIAGAIGVTLELGKTVNARIILSGGNIATLEISGVADEGLPGPSDLLKSIGFKEQGLALEKAIQANKFLSAPYIDFVSIRFNLKTKKFLSGSIYGHLEISNHQVRFSATFPRVVLSLSLDPETPILLGGMIKDTYPELNDLPTDLKLSRARAQLVLVPLDFRFDIRIADLWKTNIGAMKVEFNQLDIGIRIAKDKPITGSFATRLTLGEVDFGLLGERIAEGKKTGWHFQTRIAQSNPIKLKTIIDELTTEFGLAKADWLPETELSNITIDLNTLKETFELKASAKIKDKLGPFETIAIDLHIKVDKKDKELPLSIKIDGKLKLETSLIQFKTNFGNKNWFIDANWEKDKDEKGLALLDFVREVDPDKNLDLSNVPEAIEKGLTLQKMAFSYHNESKALVLGATNELGITLKFSLVKSGKVGAVLGLKYDHKLNESEVGKSLEIFEKDIAFKEAWLVLSWIPDGFKAPKKGGFAKGWPIAIDKMGKGILLSAKMEIRDSATGAFKLLNDSVPNSPSSFQITGQLQFSPFLTKLKLAYDGEINFKTNGDHPLTLKKCAIDIEIGASKASIGASGVLKFYVDQLAIESRISFTLSTSGIQLDLSTEFDKGLPLFGLRNVKLHSVGFSLGVDFLPAPSVRLGAEVEMTFREKQGVKDYFGLILGFTGPIPTPQYVGMDIALISLNELIENLEANKGKKSFLPDKMAELKAFSFVWALNDRTLLPDGSRVNAGVAFHGLLTINNWNAWFEFQANPTIGISGKGQLEEIDVKGFSVKAKTPDIKRLHYKQGKKWLPVSNANRLLPGVQTKPRVMLKGGGALIQFSTYKSPYFLANFDIKALGVFRAKADIAVTDQGMKFDILVNVPHLFNLNQTIEINSDKTFASSGYFSAGLNFDLGFGLKWPYWGNKNISIGIKGSYRMELGKNGAFFFRSNCRFHFLDKTIDGPSINLSYAPNDFKHIVEAIWGDFRKNIFKNLFDIIVHNKEYKAGGGQGIKAVGPRPAKRRMRKSIAPQTLVPSKLTWMDDALNSVQQKAPLLLKSGGPSKRLKKLISKAVEQTKAELADMEALFDVIENGHEELILKGEEKFDKEIGIIELEILHLKDESHALENKVRSVWESHLSTYKNQKFKYFDAEANRKIGLIDDTATKHAKAEIVKIEAKLNISFSKITDALNPKKGYANKAGKWAHVAVEHYRGMIKVELDAKLEMEYLSLQKFNQQSASYLSKSKTKKIISIKF